MLFRDRPPLPDDGIYRAILLVLVASVIIGAGLAFYADQVLHNPGLSSAAAWMAVICGALYFFFRWYGHREMEKRRRRDHGGDGGDR